MASEVKIKIKIDDNGSLSVVAKEADKASKATDKLGKATTKTNKTRSKYHKQEKGVAGATSNSTKGFAKQAQTIGGGSSGLVGAYATLAAHVFAVSAAFGVLSRNTGFKQLEEGITFTGRAAGQSLPLIAKNLKDITDSAISTADAMKAVAIGTSAGFSTSQMEGLTRVAKGASLALGRDMTDAIDRLIRGAAKLEPEILDELGIMVRLDKTAADFGATVGKNADQLTVFEKRMAFTNAIIKQGEEKFGALNSVIEVNPYSKLASQFDTLIKSFLGGIDTLLGPTVGLIAGSMGMLVGVLGIFATGIVKMMVPALTKGGDAAANMAEQMHQNAKAQIANTKAFKKAPEVFTKLQKKMADGTATAKDMTDAQNSLKRSILGHNNTMEASIKTHGEHSAIVVEKQERLDGSKAALDSLTGAQKLETQATLQAGRASVLNSASNQGLAATYTALTVQIKAEHAALTAETAATTAATAAKRRLTLVAGQAMFAVRAFGIAMLNAIPMIGTIIFFLGLAYAAYEKFFKAPPSALDKQMKDTREALDGFPEIVNQLADSYAAAANDSQRFEVSLKAQVGLVGQVADQMRKAISVQKSAIIAESAAAKANLARFNINSQDPMAAELARVRAYMEGKAPKREDFDRKPLHAGASKRDKNVRSTQDRNQPAQQQYEKAVEKHNKSLLRMLEVTERRADLVMADIKYRDSLEELTGAITEAEKKEINLEETRSAHILILSEGIAFQELLNSSMNKGSDEATIGAKTLEGLKAGLENLTKASTIKGIEAIAENMAGVALESKSALEALKAAKETAAKVDALFTKDNKGSGLFTDYRDELQKALDNLGDNDKYSEVFKKYSGVLKKFGVDITTTAKKAKEAAEKIVISMDKVRAYDNNKGERTKTREAKITSLNKGGQTGAALRQISKDLKKDSDINEERIKLAKGKGAANILAAEEERLAIVKKIAEHENAIRKHKFDTATRLMGDNMGVTGDTAQGLGDIFGEGGALSKDSESKMSEKFAAMNEAMAPMMANLRSMGSEGALVSSVVQGGLNIGESFSNVAETMTASSMDTVEGMASVAAAGLQAAGAALSSINNIMNAESNHQISLIDKQIAAEKRRDGQSKKSLEKIKQMEKKKEALEKKAFDRNKKMQMAMVVINTAAAIAMVTAQLGYLSFPFIGVMAALGAAQLAMIAGTSFEGGASSIDSGSAGKNPSATAGERSNTVDLARSQSAVGELGYSRGESGVGDANSFKPAFTGARYRASGGSTGYMVGEQGPELFMPDTPGTIVPAGETAGAGTPSNVNISIQALDSAGVEDILISQRANIISMIRESANQVGDTFLENVDTVSDGATY